MPISFDCPECGQNHQALDAAAGLSTHCERCKAPVQVPWLVKDVARPKVGEFSLARVFAISSAIIIVPLVFGIALTSESRGVATFAILAFLYFLPTVMAVWGKHLNGSAIFIVNLFLGFTVVGWVAALAWSLTGNRRVH